MCGATDCLSCGPAQGYALDDDALDDFIQREVAQMRECPELVSDAMGCLTSDDYATTDSLVFKAIAGEHDEGLVPEQLQAIGEHLVNAVLRYFEQTANEL